ncbi:MAG: hypothetical protein WCG27_13150 [Pseudomonadota bacterium]
MKKSIFILCLTVFVGQIAFWGHPVHSGPTEQKTPKPISKKSPPIPSEIKHCLWAIGQSKENQYSFEHSHIGKYNLCQSRSRANVVFVQLAQSVSDSQICLIPTHHKKNVSTFVGEPRCFRADDPRRIYRIDLIKNRKGMEPYDIDGVMIIKDQINLYPAPFQQNLLGTDSYLFCQQWLAQKGDPSYCQAFGQVGAFIDHQF